MTQNPNSKNTLTITLPNGLTFNMIFVKGGTYKRGSEEYYDREQPILSVTLKDFYIGEYAVTQELYEQVIGENPSDFKGKKRPVEQVSWNDINRTGTMKKPDGFLYKLNKMLQNNYNFRLPTETEWEYAARGGIHWEANQKYIGINDLKQVGWYTRNSGDETKPVGLLLPNGLGLYDMSGNVWEWCEDQYHDSYKGSSEDGSAWVDKPHEAAYRVIRGGSSCFNPIYCRPSYRTYFWPSNRDPYVGFRLCFSSQLDVIQLPVS